MPARPSPSPWFSLVLALGVCSACGAGDPPDADHGPSSGGAGGATATGGAGGSVPSQDASTGGQPGGGSGGSGGQPSGPDAAPDSVSPDDASPLPDGSQPTDSGVDAPLPPPCSNDADCGGWPRGCFAGLCRDKCFPFVNPCDWKPSGNVCNTAGYCVECQVDSDCPGTRYRCDTSSFTCVDKPFDPSITKIGVFYHTWHCPAAADVHDLTKIVAGQAPYGDYNEFHWWGEPADGYYCLTNNTALLTKHAQQLRDMGVDFVFVDVTNHAWNSNALCDRPVQMIIEPFTTLVNVWSGIPGAPRIVPWVPVPGTDAAHPESKLMVNTLLGLLGSHPGLQFVYQGKPLVLVTENASYPVDEARLASLSATYTVRKMWAFEPKGTAKWSYIEKCASSPLEGEPCFQRAATLAGKPEQLPITLAYGADYMSHTSSATPKHHGKTFRKQFQTLLDNPEMPIATITGWNEWVVQRLKCDEHPLCVCSNPQDVNGCFLDQYGFEYNRDIEPGKNALGSYYYDLVKSCIALFRAGKRCTPDNAGDPCCKD